jgi:hypothetical protein
MCKLVISFVGELATIEDERNSGLKPLERM